MVAKIESNNFSEELDEYERWIDMKWGVNRYEDDDIFPIISMRDDIHEMIRSKEQAISDNDIVRLKNLDKKWQEFLEKNRASNFRFNFRISEPKTKWWWWIDRLDELTDEDKKAL